MTDSAPAAGEPTSPAGDPGSTPGSDAGLDDIESWDPAAAAAEEGDDDNGGAGSGAPSRGGNLRTSDGAFARPDEAADPHAEGEDDEQDPADPNSDEERAFNDAVKRLKLEGKSPAQIARALASAYWRSNNSGAESARQLRQENAALYAELQEVRMGRPSGNTPPLDEQPETRAPQPPTAPPPADPAASDPAVAQLQSRIDSMTQFITQDEAAMQAISQQTMGSGGTQERVIIARAQWKDSPEEFKAERFAAYRAAVQEHNALAERYETLNARVFQSRERAADLQDRLQDAQARAQERQRTQEQQARETRRWVAGQSHLFSSTVEQHMRDLQVPEEDRAEFFEDVQASVSYTLRRQKAGAPPMDLDRLIEAAVQRKVKLAGRNLTTPQDRAQFAAESGQKLRTAQVLRPGGQATKPSTPSAAPANRAKPGQRTPSWDEQAAAAKRRAARILGG